MSVHETGSRALIVYESGLLMVGHDLDVVWHVSKHLDDVFVGIEGDAARLTNEQIGAWAVRLSDGVRVS